MWRPWLVALACTAAAVRAQSDDPLDDGNNDTPGTTPAAGLRPEVCAEAREENEMRKKNKEKEELSK